MLFDLRNVRISTLLVVGSSAFVAVIAAVAIASAVIAKQSNIAIDTLYQQRLVPLEHLKTLADLYAEMVFKANQVVLGRADPAQALAGITQSIQSIQHNWDSLSTTAQDAKDKIEFTKALALVEKLTPSYAELLDSLVKKDRVRTNLVMVDLNDLINAINKQINVLEQIQLDHSSSEYAAANAQYMASNRGFTLVVFIVLCVTAALAWIVIRQITAPIHKAVDIAKRVAAGNMSEAISYAGRNEMTEMLRALADMQQSLGRVVHTVRDSANRLANASQEIAQGNLDLSDRTEQQATLLEQTGNAARELADTVKTNTESTHQANAVARKAAEVAQVGGDTVARVVHTMQEIDQSSQRIGAIISVIDGIAFQTNILALNAAVEAARAGEQGRGFAVVASEVRALAGRSAEAAKEIKMLINASVQKVKAGTQQVDRAGKTMAEVVDSINQVTGIMQVISASSDQQQNAVMLVARSVSEISQSTQKNSALVEEIASSASDLSGQANHLVQTVEVFKLPDHDFGSSPAPDR